MNKQILAKAANEARGLAMDAVHKCSSGHLGLPLGAAEIGAVLFGEALQIKPEKWIDSSDGVLKSQEGFLDFFSASAFGSNEAHNNVIPFPLSKKVNRIRSHKGDKNALDNGTTVRRKKKGGSIERSSKPRISVHEWEKYLDEWFALSHRFVVHLFLLVVLIGTLWWLGKEKLQHLKNAPIDLIKVEPA